jgi:hypothetical protein
MKERAAVIIAKGDFVLLNQYRLEWVAVNGLERIDLQPGRIRRICLDDLSSTPAW